MRLIRFLAGLAFAALAGLTQAAHAQTPPARPNIVLIVLDDIAFMDFGAYGGEARTPNIDRLAERGAMFLNYHTSPLCTPSRSMLLTGADNHRTGHATIEEVLPDAQRGQPGYSLRFEPGVVTVAERLRAAGYRTLMSGKWHLGRQEGDLPNSHGFERSLALDASGADNYAQKSYMPYYDHAPWFEDGQPTRLPERFYSSDLLVDRLIGFIDEQPPGAEPHFSYLAFQAVHIPLQVPRAFSDGYEGRFDAGWDVLREERWTRAKALGLIPADAPLAPMPEGLRKWDDLSADQQRIFARSMEVYAGMIEATDQAIGRLVAHLDTRGELENTVFVITSDNGPEPSDPVHARGMNLWMPLNGYHWDPDRLGEEGSLAFIGTEWAAAVASPHAYYKFYTSQGGIKVPLIVSGPGVAPGGRSTALAHVTDVVPTVLELSGVEGGPAPNEVPVIGRSLAPILTGSASTVRSPTDVVGIEVSGNAALFRGNHKIVRNMPPAGDNQWRLFDLSRDPGETADLASAQPELLADMIAAYDAYAQANGVLPLPPGYHVQRQLLHTGLMKQLEYNALWLALIGAFLVFWIAWRVFRPKRKTAP